MDSKMLPIGADDFEKIRTAGYYYVDKSSLIRELLMNRGEVNLFTRPRRFGKSLNMSMLRCFFEIGTDTTLFDGLEISKDTGICQEHLGQYPVISISLKTAHGENYEFARNELRSIIGKEALRFRFLLDSDRLYDEEKDLYRQLITDQGTKNNTFIKGDSVLTNSLNTLSMLLERHYGKKVIILIDEYDVPLAKANERGYYDRMIGLVRNMLDAGLKTNRSLYFAVLTGCLRISKESIFTGLNNMKTDTLLDAGGSRQFGFTDAEVRQMLEYYELSGYYDITREWYDGYRIANESVYNPWDVINWCSQLLTSPDKRPKSYWKNSSGNEEVRYFIRRMGNGVTKAQMERLISGETVQKMVEEQLTYNTMYNSVENLWSLLFATGYLTPGELPAGNLVRLKIPNSEVREIFRDFILELFEEHVAEDGVLVSEFCSALKDGDAAGVERLFTQCMKKTISIRDTAVKKEFKENFYHGLLLGILVFKSDWGVDSNREAGDGCYDIQIEIEDESIGIVIEVKYAENENFNAACQEALDQINDHNYTAELKEDDMKTILKYGIACYKKQCRVVLERENIK